MELPLYVSIVQSVNTFTNLKFKVIEIVHSEEFGYQVQEVVKATYLVDDRFEIDKETGGYELDKEGNKIPKININERVTSPIPLEGLNATLPKAIDENTPSEKTYSIIIKNFDKLLSLENYSINLRTLTLLCRKSIK